MLEALENYRADPLFCVPPRARDIVARHGRQTCFVLLGSKDFTAVFLAAVPGHARVLGVVDDFKFASGEKFHGAEIITTARMLELCKADPDIIALNCCRFDYSRRFFENLCRVHDIPLLNHEQAVRLLALDARVDHRTADWGPVISSRFDEFLALERRMADPYSTETLRAVLTFHLTCDPEWHMQVARPYSSLYFRSGLFAFSKTEKFVDCGASIGESTTGLIGVTNGNFSHIWMIEPDRFNIETLKKLQARHAGTAIADKLSLHPLAVGESASEAPFHHQGGHSGSIAPIDATSGAAGSPGALDYVQVRTIDSIIDDAPTFIKMDIEGFELPALHGAEAAIRASHPKLALSAYHRPTDLLELPAYIDSIAPGYTLGLRHHTEDRWDTCLYFYR
jgi:FkbM family methyltransferase